MDLVHPTLSLEDVKSEGWEGSDCECLRSEVVRVAAVAGGKPADEGSCVT